jgi:hypothetical protein
VYQFAEPADIDAAQSESAGPEIAERPRTELVSEQNLRDLKVYALRKALPELIGDVSLVILFPAIFLGNHDPDLGMMASFQRFVGDQKLVTPSCFAGAKGDFLSDIACFEGLSRHSY